MSSMVFGEVDWNAADSGGKSDFMRLEEGESLVRVMGNPVQFYVHWLTAPDGSKRKVNSPLETPELVRRLEDVGFKRQARWFLKVLNCAANEFQLLEIGPQIYNGVKALNNNSRWGKVSGYDISITKGPKGSQPLYGVTPNPKEALQADLKDAFVAFNDRVNLEKLITPAECSDICDIMGWDASEYNSGAATESAEEKDFNFDFS
jgi:hypothetical protein